MATENEISKELEEISPLLSGLPKKTPYSAPQGYFEQLPSAILEQVQRSKVVAMTPRRRTWRLAAAAVVAGILALGSWFFIQKQSSVNTFAQNETSIQKGMQQVSESEMADYVAGNDVAPAYDASSSAQINSEDISLVLADVSDQELQHYLDMGDSFKEQFN